MRGFLRFVGRALLLVLLTLAVAELALQAAALFAHGRENDTHAENAYRVLCVGDSHTYGAMLPAVDSYPGHLQRLLDEKSPGTYAVVNLGIPGQNTTQVRNRLHGAIATYRPNLIVVWCGVNNAWNRRDSATPWTLDGVLSHLRLYRLVRVWRHDLQIEGGLRRFEITTDPRDPEKNFTISMGDRTEHVRYEDSGFHGDEEMARRAEKDYRAMVADARAAGIPIAFIAYPVEEGAFALANQAMRKVATEAGVPLVEAGRVVQRIPPDERKLLSAGHPSSRIYGEVARDVVRVVLSKGAGPAGPAPDEPIARLAFEGKADTGTVNGPCARIATGCAEGAGCYRWDPRGVVCNVQTPLTEPVAAARLTARMRVVEFPSGAGGHDVLSVFEDTYGTGVYVEVVQTDRLGLLSWGKGGARVHCGPLGPHLTRGTWYGVEVRADKSDHARVSLTLRGPDGAVLDTTTCADQPSGGGYFTRLRLGNGNPEGSTADVMFDDVDVRAGAPGK